MITPSFSSALHTTLTRGERIVSSSLSKNVRPREVRIRQWIVSSTIAFAVASCLAGGR